MRNILNEWQQFEESLLLESPEALGFPEDIAKIFYEKFEGDTKSHNKFRHWLASQYKNARVVPVEPMASQSLGSDSLTRVLKREERIKKSDNVREKNKKSYKKIMKKTGIGYNHDSLKSYFIEEKRVPIDEFINLYKKIKKIELNNGTSLFYINLKTYFKERVEDFFEDINITEKGENLLELVEEKPSSAYKVVKNKNHDEALLQLQKWFIRNSYDEDKVIHKFNDGYFWYGPLTEAECDFEGEQMQHCGTGDADMYSLRDEDNKPHATIEFDKDKNEIYQIKGKQNDLPDQKYWDYIKAWIDYWEPHFDLRGNWSDTNWGDDIIREFSDHITEDVPEDIVPPMEEARKVAEKYKEKFKGESNISLGYESVDEYLNGGLEIEKTFIDLKFDKNDEKQIEQALMSDNNKTLYNLLAISPRDFNYDSAEIKTKNSKVKLVLTFEKIIKRESDVRVFRGWLQDIEHRFTSGNNRLGEFVLDLADNHGIGAERSEEEKEEIDDLTDRLTEKIKKRVKQYAR